MFWSFCSAKGGVGVSVLTAACALEAARLGPVTVVDFHGDIASILGVDVGDRPGVSDWLCADELTDAASLARLCQPVADSLQILPAGTLPGRGLPEAGVERLQAFVEAARSVDALVVADVGVLHAEVNATTSVLCALSSRTSLVVRGCFLALRRSSQIPVSVDDLVEVIEPGRALTTIDIEGVLRQPVTVRIPVAPSVARAVDAGTLAQRMPRSLRRPVQQLIGPVMAQAVR